jgi:hypothetical protein
LQSAVLAVKHLPVSHTGENIAKGVKDVMSDWAITSKVFSLVTDNSSVMTDLANRLKLTHLGCAAHTLNLVVSDVFGYPELDAVNLLRQKCRKIVTFLKAAPLVLTN